MKTKFLLLLIWIFSMSCSQNGFQNVDVEAFETLCTRDNVVIVDVRTPEEFSTGHIANAVNIDFKNPDFKSEFLKTVNKDKIVALYCRSGRRSAGAASIISEEGYKEIYNLQGGILSWQQQNKPIEK